MESCHPNTTVSLCHWRFLVSLLLTGWIRVSIALDWGIYILSRMVSCINESNKQTLDEDSDLESESRSKKIKRHQLGRAWPWLSLSSRTSHCRGFGHRSRFDRPVTPIEGDHLMWLDIMGCHMTFFFFFFSCDKAHLTGKTVCTDKNRYHQWKTPQNRVQLWLFFLLYMLVPLSKKYILKPKKARKSRLCAITMGWGTSISLSRYFRPDYGITLSKCEQILGFCRTLKLNWNGRL